MLDDVYTELLKMKLCKSRSDFSTRWLSRNEAYYRTIQCKDLRPSAKVIAKCGHKLRNVGQNLIESEYDFMRAKGERLSVLAEQCFKDAIEQCAD